jgi:hypothetical protein
VLVGARNARPAAYDAAGCAACFVVVRGDDDEVQRSRGGDFVRSTRSAMSVDTQEALWRRDTFAHVLGGVPSINFASVIADVSYVLPGTEDSWGLTLEDLAHDKFEYLRTIE